MKNSWRQKFYSTCRQQSCDVW